MLPQLRKWRSDAPSKLRRGESWQSGCCYISQAKMFGQGNGDCIGAKERLDNHSNVEAESGNQMIKSHTIGFAKTTQSVARQYCVPMQIASEIHLQAIRLMQSVNKTKCNGRRRGTIKLSGFCAANMGDFVRFELSYTLIRSGNHRIGSRSFRMYLYGDLRKLFKRLAPYRVASAQKSET